MRRVTAVHSTFWLNGTYRAWARRGKGGKGGLNEGCMRGEKDGTGLPCGQGTIPRGEWAKTVGRDSKTGLR